MEIIFSRDKHHIDTSKGMGIVLGNFDGVHLGHVELIKRVINTCKKNNLKSMLYTFSNHPENIIAGKIVIPLITTNRIKAKILAAYDLNYLYFDEFNESLMKMNPIDFVEKVLVDQFNVKAVTVGFHYHFGYQGKGDANLLRILGREYGFGVDVVEPVKLGDTIVSSTVIRNLIKEGNVEQASKFLGRKYTISGKVVRGKNLGNKIGFPTINLLPNDYLVLPSKGVYITNTIINDCIFYSVTNVGENPTIDEDGIRIETHVLNFKGDLYDSDVAVQFIKKIRDEKKFNSISDLSKQIAKDVQFTYEYFNCKGIYNKINMC
ncbi:MAG: riboflavin kinase / adenylyltransferase [Clostridiales bacterium]|nr:riboflavin kinase / adenylyltransferase [Clostridiales bacterium]